MSKQKFQKIYTMEWINNILKMYFMVVAMNEIEEKTKEISEKWKSKMQEQGINKPTYKFYRQNQVELFNDFEELWRICKLEELEQLKLDF